jgi:Putative undecaprenyl diphosphate synthase
VRRERHPHLGHRPARPALAVSGAGDRGSGGADGGSGSLPAAHRRRLLGARRHLRDRGETSREAFARLLADPPHDGRPVPDVDLLIRTGGEQRLSDFLLWECAYAELVFTDRMWPDFTGADLAEAVREFYGRERRFGTVPELVSVAELV